MYTLREIVDGGEKPALIGIDVMCGESRAAGFKGGLSLMITTTHAALGVQAQQAFLHGIVLAMSHCSITGSVPSVVDR